MLIDTSHLAVESDHRRAAMLADAENFRLARLARQARRRLRDAPRSDPPRAPEHGRSAPSPAQRNDHAERRYAVPR